MQINPFKPEFHDTENFREQVALLYYGGVFDDYVLVHRSWEFVHSAGAVGFDDANPGQSTADGFLYLHNKIVDEQVIGTFHTHPPFVDTFSSMDDASHRAMAKAFGKKLLWYGVQSCTSGSCYFRAAHMVNKQVIFYDFEAEESRINDSILLLPIPPRLTDEEGVIRYSI